MPREGRYASRSECLGVAGPLLRLLTPAVHGQSLSDASTTDLQRVWMALDARSTRSRSGPLQDAGAEAALGRGGGCRCCLRSSRLDLACRLWTRCPSR